MAFTELHFSILPKGYGIKDTDVPSTLCWWELKAGGAKVLIYLKTETHLCNILPAWSCCCCGWQMPSAVHCPFINSSLYCVLCRLVLWGDFVWSKAQMLLQEWLLCYVINSDLLLVAHNSGNPKLMLAHAVYINRQARQDGRWKKEGSSSSVCLLIFIR